MAKIYKMIVTTTYYTERIVKANSKEDVEKNEDRIIKTIDLLDDIPDVNVCIEERDDHNEDEADIDLTENDDNVNSTNKYDVPYHCYEIDVLEKFGNITKHYIDVGCEEDWGDIQGCIPGDCEDWKYSIGYGNDADGHKKIVRVFDQEDGKVWEGNDEVRDWYEKRVAIYFNCYAE